MATVPQFLVHDDGDDVAVAVTDIEPGPAHGAVLRSDADVAVDVRDSVPLGHKIALHDLAAGDPVIEYGVQVAVATAAIGTGEYVHTHNVRSARWQTSIAN
jgi:(2R)-sulfolactate sulfo-lyase subunit alpha